MLSGSSGARTEGCLPSACAWDWGQANLCLAKVVYCSSTPLDSAVSLPFFTYSLTLIEHVELRAVGKEGVQQ